MNTNTMSPHIRKTVEEIDGDILQLNTDIERLTTMRTGLVDLYGGDTDVPPAPIQAPRAKSASREKRPAKSTTVTAAPGSGRQPTAESVKLLSIVRTAPEPFTAASLAVASGFDTKFCANRLHKWKESEIVEKVGRGEFKRAGQFPGTAPAE